MIKALTFMNKTHEILGIEEDIEILERMKIDVEEKRYHYQQKLEEMEITLRDTNNQLDRKYKNLQNIVNPIEDINQI